MDGKTAAEENGGTMDDCSYGGGCIIADGGRYLYKTMGKITEACKTSEKIEGRRRGKNPKDTPPQLRDVGNYCTYIHTAGQIVGTHCASLLTNRASSRTLNLRGNDDP